jgi:hypothetical protein
MALKSCMCADVLKICCIALQAAIMPELTSVKLSRLLGKFEALIIMHLTRLYLIKSGAEFSS